MAGVSCLVAEQWGRCMHMDIATAQCMHTRQEQAGWNAALVEQGWVDQRAQPKLCC